MRTIEAKFRKSMGRFEPLEPIELPHEEVAEIAIPEGHTDEDNAAFLSSAGGWKTFFRRDSSPKSPSVAKCTATAPRC